MFLKTISLRFSIPLICTLLFTVGSTVLVSLFYRDQVEQLYSAALTKTEKDLETFSVKASLLMTDSDTSSLILLCQSLKRLNSHLSSVMIIDREKLVIAHHNSALVGKRLKGSINFKNYDLHKISTQRNVYKASLPPIISLHLSNQANTGMAVVKMSDREIKQQLSQYRITYVLLLFCLATLFFIITFSIVSFMVVRPLKRVANGMMRTSSGNFYHRILQNYQGEINTLKQLFNALNTSLQIRNNHFMSLYRSTQSLGNKREHEALQSHLFNLIDSVIGPSHCLIALVKDHVPTITAVSGFDSEYNLVDRQLILDNEEFQSLFQGKTARRYTFEVLAPTFDDCDLPQQFLTNEVVLAPITHQKNSKGIFVLMGKKDASLFNDADLQSLDIIALATALSLFDIELSETFKKRKLTSTESYSAAIVRSRLLPQAPVKLKGIEVCGFYKPAENISGNWYWFVEDEEKELLSLFIGDAAGFGLDALLTVSMIQSFVQTVKNISLHNDTRAEVLQNISSKDSVMGLLYSPAYLLAMLNQLLFENGAGKQFMTLFAATINLKEQTITFANAGHEIPILIKNESTTPQVLTSSGPRLGDSALNTYQEQKLALESGDTIIGYTTGLTHCTNKWDEQFGKARLVNTCQEGNTLSSKELCKSIVNRAFSFRINAPLKEDIALLTAKLR